MAAEVGAHVLNPSEPHLRGLQNGINDDPWPYRNVRAQRRSYRQLWAWRAKEMPPLGFCFTLRFYGRNVSFFPSLTVEIATYGSGMC